MIRRIHPLATAIAIACAGSAFAAAIPEELSQLGTTLTPWGATKAGNKDGTIPEYTPGGIKPPASYDPKKPHVRPDPFASEKPLFSITAANVAQYADKLSAGVQAMFKKYPGYRMDVYPTHRTANYPQYILDNARKNAAGECKTTDDGLRLQGCYAGWPFPFPKTGAEVMWNRLLKFDGHAMMTNGMTGTLVDTAGNRTVTGVGTMWILYPIMDPARTTPIESKELFEMLRIDYSDPARKAGEKLIVRDSIDLIDPGRRAWSYLPGQRRVKLAPDIAFDTPSPTGGGASVVDESAVFYGSLERYDFKLVGKKEMYIPYNAFKINDPGVCPGEVAMNSKNFLNPDCVRWELHRTWVVEATLKPGMRHVYPKRMIYWDEDLPGVGVSDNYDSSGQIYRVSHSLPIVMYETQGHQTDQWVTYDLQTGNYTRQEDTTDSGGWVMTPPKPLSFYSSEALAGSGVR